MTLTSTAPSTALAPQLQSPERLADDEVVDEFLDVMDRATWTALLGAGGGAAVSLGATCAVSFGLPVVALLAGFAVAVGGGCGAFACARAQALAEAEALGISRAAARLLLRRYLRWGAVPRRLPSISAQERRSLCAAHLGASSPAGRF